MMNLVDPICHRAQDPEGKGIIAFIHDLLHSVHYVGRALLVRILHALCTKAETLRDLIPRKIQEVNSA